MTLEAMEHKASQLDNDVPAIYEMLARIDGKLDTVLGLLHGPAAG